MLNLRWDLILGRGGGVSVQVLLDGVSDIQHLLARDLAHQLPTLWIGNFHDHSIIRVPVGFDLMRVDTRRDRWFRFGSMGGMGMGMMNVADPLSDSDEFNNDTVNSRKKKANDLN